MATDDRKKRILDHLAKSADGVKFGTPRTPSKSQSSDSLIDSTPSVDLPSPPPIPQPVVSPTPSKESRKRRVMDHVKMSSVNFKDYSVDTEKRKQKISDHLRKSQS
ncbi:conserved hypothetical protein [Gloeothece citriformis PCC 7424]|uniref:Uncharacterized protein n=1 Tax=Gloeothece citriformis (strain PCC 7424) TaxID=65393 RepID=B7KBW1_GLOC7|nr:hypothetical protein [Gloeothece citriformis]ACK68784.1 conserved hypothetical protein [Gloeothece citriformis PCC 7424]